jgi:D-beta-D-heptose 7-phosphate kinase/D-beta-D-heptose 1-phosphate adenosyltransferase
VSYHLIDLVQNLGHPRILVLGDLILDRYTWGDAERISQEAPVILLREQSREIRLGGAANVANMLRGLEAEVTLAGVVGRDADGHELRDALEQQKIDCRAVVVDSLRPTTVKERFIGRAQQRHPHQILRVDREVRHPLDDAVAASLLEALLSAIKSHDCVLISDYGKGVCTPDVCRRVIQAARQAGLPVIVDPSSSGDCRNFVGATAVTPNRMETKRATGREIARIDDAVAAGKRLCADLRVDHAFVTLDSDGIVVVRSDGSAEHLSTRKREVYDITGAGDMVLATIGVGSAAGIAPFDLARLANVAGGLEVEQVGVVRITRNDLLADLFGAERTTADKICSLEVLARHVAARRRLGNRIVLTNGCFDLLHVGHVTYLQQAAREGDCLVVAVNSDASVRQLDKGPDRPVFGQDQRAAMLAALEAVDYVIIFDEATPHALLDRLKPDLLVKGGGYAPHEIVGHELVESYGGQVKALGHVPGISTTLVLEQVRQSTDSIRQSKDPTATQARRKAG